MEFTIKVEMLVTMFVDLERICKANGIDHKLPEKEALIRAPNVSYALGVLHERLVKWGQSTFPQKYFGDDNVVAHFQLLNNKKVAIVEGAVAIVWPGSLTIHKRRHRG